MSNPPVIQRIAAILLVIFPMLLLAACDPMNKIEKESLGPGESAKWSDADNFDIISVTSYNYTDYDIYDVYLLPPDKNSLDYAADGTGARATRRDEKRWRGGGLGGRAALAWDFQWATPKKLKVWWLRVADKKIFDAFGNSDAALKYDRYTDKNSMPGTAWCEGEITVTRPPIKDKISGIVLHFFADGHVDGDMNFRAEQSPPKIELSKRDEQPELTVRACLKEISNPFYGRKKPIAIN
ncbi:MAG: DUF3304 domain-containing protein [Burkholderiaceae bacterium]|jgi:hypothetical protein|nr:DUF3304 domain-containing protein [Burkholderiaceae bacterium]